MPLARHDTVQGFFLFDTVFLLTCLLRGMTIVTIYTMHNVSFLLTCLLRGMTATAPARLILIIVSTHMPLARHDTEPIQAYRVQFRFYSHASCEA